MIDDNVFVTNSIFDQNNNTEDENLLYDEDGSLAMAQFKCIETGTVLPLLKEELKFKILAKCHQEGKELNTEPETVPPPPKKKLEPDERKRLEKRREQNRRAAKKFRERKRSETDRLEQTTSELEAQNKDLKDEVRRLNTELSQLLSIMKTHNCVANIFPAIFDEPGILDAS